jgi:hypothetical protein
MPDDLHTLTDAFAELERRADAASADTGPAPLVRHRNRTMLVAASVVGVAALATGTALLAGGSDSPSRAPAAGGSTSAAAVSPVAPSPTAPSSAAASPVAPSPTGAAGFQIPQTANELADRFRVVLGGTAAFTVTDTGHPVIVGVPIRISSGGTTTMSVAPAVNNGAAIVGTLTASGVTGGFDIQIFQSDPGAKASCDDPDSSTCEVRRLRDGSSLATGSEPLQNNADGVTYQADLIRADGVEFLMHMSNERDPKGESAVLAAQPPLSLDQMGQVLRSDRW